MGRTSHERGNRNGQGGPPRAHLGAKTWQQLDQPVVKAQEEATEATQMGVGVL